ncbi:hypothetical protein WA026_004790 [Henosepilachna vigintioctopunctata]|uniref:Apolipoprotein D n=1 Tax=Henosepilachna vigintioctopunctata TaxID=420089 RepID=A0AAW1V8N8_9CUCU
MPSHTKSFISIFVFLVCFYGVKSQVPFLGPCQHIETVKGFDAARYMGRWYEAERYFAFFEIGGKCVTADYQLNNGSVDVFNRQINEGSGEPTSIKGIARIVGRSDEGKLNVRFPSLPVQFDAPYWVLDTDYENYALVWSCVDFGLFNAKNAWILTRARNPTPDIIQKVHSIADKLHVDRTFFSKTDQSNCPN